MLQKLEQSIPLGGPKWVNWSNLITTLLGALIIFLGGFTGGKVYGWVQEHRTLPIRTEILEAQVQTIDSRTKEMRGDIKDVLALMKTHLEYEKVFIGRSIIGRNGASNGDRGIWLNSNSQVARHYIEGNEICLTVLSNERKRCGIEVLGFVKNPDVNVISEMTSSVANLLRITEAEILTVSSDGSKCVSIKIEPFYKEQ